MMELTTYTELEIMHRLGGAYSGRCLHPHGHRYEVEITVTSQKFNDDGMIVDFKKLKEVVRGVLDDQWDHGACVHKDDPLAPVLMSDAHHERVHIINANPTLEWMVEHWVIELQEALGKECPGIIVTQLKASETARNTVTWRIDRLPWDIPRNGREKDNFSDENECRQFESGSSEPEEDNAGPEEDNAGPEEDTDLYLVQFRTENRPYSTTVRTSFRGEALIHTCIDAINREDLPGQVETERVRVLLGITRIPE